MSRILYPKPLPNLIKSTITYESGFTSTEVKALQNGWRLFKRRFNYHTRKIFVVFFIKNDSLLERFLYNDTLKFNLTSLHQHPKQLLNLYGQLIESGLNDMAYINMVMIEVSYRHKMHGVTYEEIKLHTDHITHYIIEYLDKIKSSTFVTGLNKLSELINSYHYEKQQGEGENQSSKQSDENLN